MPPNANGSMAEMTIQLCRITATTPAYVTKEFSLEAGKLQKSTVANVTRGNMQIQCIKNAEDFSQLLQSLGPSQCLTYGIPPNDAELVTEKVWNTLGQPQGPFPRTIAVFNWPKGAGIMMLDYDPPKDGRPPLGKKALLKLLLDAVPMIGSSWLVWWPSTSSHIYANGEEMSGLKGQRIYLSVKDASDIPRAGAVLNERLWARGYGHFEVSKSGQLLKRNVFDGAVWQPNRIDFAAGAKCGPGIEQRRGAPFVYAPENSELLDTRKALPDLTEEEANKAETIQRQHRSQASPAAEQKKGAWIKDRTDELIRLNPTITQKNATGLVRRAIESNDLASDWRITVKCGDELPKEIPVLEALNNPDQYDGALTLDPLEPDYDGGRWVGKLYLKGPRPNLFSFAHGGICFRLHREPARIEVVGGKSTSTTDKLLDVLRNASDYFDFGADLVRVGHAGTLHPLNESSLQYFAGGLVQFWESRVTQSGTSVERLLDPPVAICRSITALGAQRNLKKLTSVITAPTLRPNGTLLNAAGYDESTGLLFDPPETLPAIPLFPTCQQAKEALGFLWNPFQDFPFCSRVDRAVHLAAILTATVRPSLSTAPGFAYDAPVQGSGKTLLARCIGAIVQGDDPSVWPHTAGRDDEEVRKRIFTVLRSGARVLIWDNVVGAFDSQAMASCMTSPNLTDRILGKSSSSTVPNRMMLILTGNNLLLQGEMPRRILISRIDPATEQPFSRSFDLDPFAYCRQNRQRMVAAALTVIRASLNHGCSEPIKGKLASFEEWDSWVRHAVLYANELMPGMFGDVMDSIKANQQVDPEQEALANLLKACEERYGPRYFTVAEMIKDAATFSYNEQCLRLKEALVELPVANPQQLNAKSIGKYIGNRKRRIVAGRCFEMGGKIDDRTTWRVKVTQAGRDDI